MENFLFSAGLVVIGLLLLAVEFFVIPGFGFAGVVGTALVFGGTFVAWTQLGPTIGVLMLGASVTVAMIFIWLVIRSPAARRMVLSDHVSGDSVDHDGLKGFVGRRGVAETDLRPSGTATFDDDRHHVMTDGEYIVRGTPVEVVRVSTNTLVVVRVEHEVDEPDSDKTGS